MLGDNSESECQTCVCPNVSESSGLSRRFVKRVPRGKTPFDRSYRDFIRQLLPHRQTTPFSGIFLPVWRFQAKNLSGIRWTNPDKRILVPEPLEHAHTRSQSTVRYHALLGGISSMLPMTSAASQSTRAHDANHSRNDAHSARTFGLLPSGLVHSVVLSGGNEAIIARSS